MIVKEEFLSRLRKIFDLNLYEVKVWAALLSRGTSTAGELSSISDVPRSRTYDILESLEKKGFIVMKLGKPIQFVALKPEEVIERVKRNLIVNAKEKSKRLEKLKGDEVLEELTSIFSEGIKYVEPSDLSGALKSRQNIYNHLDMLVREAESTITLVTTADGLTRKLEVLLPSLEKAKKRGVKIRIAAPITQQNLKVAKAQVAKIEAELSKNYDSLMFHEKWILSRVRYLSDLVSNSMETFEFSDAWQELQTFTKNEFCDYYIEEFKLTKETSKYWDKVITFVLNTLLKLWHPYIPFVTEEIYARLGFSWDLIDATWWKVTLPRNENLEKDNVFVLTENNSFNKKDLKIFHYQIKKIQI